MEIWKDIEGYEGYYQVSNKGRVKTIERIATDSSGRVRRYDERITKERTRPNGYKYVELSKENTSAKISVHRLVAIAFVPNVKNKPQVNHINGRKEDNNYTNLEWVTPKENIKHAQENGLKSKFHKGRKVIQKDNEGLIINEFKSMGMASKLTGIQRSSIEKACKGTYKHAGGYNWSFQEVKTETEQARGRTKNGK